MLLKGAVECKHIKAGLADKLFVLIIILLQYVGVNVMLKFNCSLSSKSMELIKTIFSR